MAILDIDGIKVEVDDGFFDMTPEEQEATVDEIADSLAAGRPASETERSGGIEGAVRAAGRGVLGIGSYLDELNAATNATLSPIVDPLLPDEGYEKLPGENWSDRYAQALEIQRRKDAEYDQDNPVTSTALKIAGGVGSGGALLKAAPVAGSYLLGNTGATIPARLAAAIGSGVGTGAVQGFGAGEGDAVNRLKQAGLESVVGGVTGGAMMPISAGVNKVAQALTKRLLGETDDALSSVSDQARRYIVSELSEPNKTAAYRDRLNELGPEAMLADVAPEWLGVARGSAARPGTRGLVIDPLNERSAMANTRLRGDIEANLGGDPIPSRIEAEIAEAQGRVGNLYRDAFQEGRPFDTQVIADDLNRSIDMLRGPAQQALQRVRGMLNINNSDQISTEPSTLFQTRQAIDGMLDGEQNTRVISALTEARQMLDDALTQSVPRIKEIDAAYSELARQREGLGMGRPILNNEATAMRPVELEQALAAGAEPGGVLVGPSGMSTRMRQGALGEIYRAIGTKANDTTALRNIVRGEGDWNRDKLAMLFGDQPADNALGAIDRETVFGDTANRVTRGSDTAMASGFGRYLDDVGRSQEVPGDTTVTGLGIRGLRAVAGAMLQRSAQANVGELAEQLGSLSVAQGDARDRVIEAIMRRGQENVVDQQRMALINALMRSGGLAAYPSLTGAR